MARRFPARVLRPFACAATLALAPLPTTGQDDPRGQRTDGEKLTDEVVAEALEGLRGERDVEAIPDVEAVATHLFAAARVWPKDGALHPIVKWEQPVGHVKLALPEVIAGDPEEREAAIRAVTPTMLEASIEIRALTGFTYRFPGELAEGELADLIILYGTPETLLEDAALAEESLGIEGLREGLRASIEAGRPACVTGMVASEGYALDTVVFTVDATGPVEPCVIKGVVESMGLAVIEDPPVARDGGQDELSAIQRIALRILYSGTLEAGDTPSLSEILRLVSSLMPKDI